MDRNQLADHIKASVSIVDVVGRYVQLSRAGSNHKGLCPFHNEATPSFLVTDAKGIYKCFGCGEGGDVISFLSKMEGISYGEALGRLAEQAGTPQQVLNQLQHYNRRHHFEQEFNILKFAQGFYQYYLLNTVEGKVALDYLASRGITKDIIGQFGIGLAPSDGRLLIKALESNSHSFEVAKNAGLIRQGERGDDYSLFKSRIMFQVTNEQGNVVGFSGRTYVLGEDNHAKYINSPESRVFQKSQLVYNLHEARKVARTTGRLLMFEGFLDVIAAHKAGFTESVATMGTSLTASHAKILSRHAREVILVFDGDQAGLAATAKAIPILFAAGLQVRVVHIPDGLDPDDYVKQHGARKFAEVVNNSLGAIDFQYEYAKQGINIHTTDGAMAFERRLTDIGKQFGIGEELVWKFRMGEKKNRVNKDKSVHQPFTPVSREELPSTQRDIKIEKELIYYMLLDKKVFVLVDAQIGTAFNIDEHRKIVQAIEAYYAKHDAIRQDEFLNGLDIKVQSFIQEIIKKFGEKHPAWSEEIINSYCNQIKFSAMERQRNGKKEKLLESHQKVSRNELLRMMEESSKLGAN